ncbi:hypothetical protein GCM10022221_77680 [Actinocorallia aurea]
MPALGVAEALAAVHAAGLVHRDLKPGNVLLSADGPRVIDFGIARAADAAPLTRTGARMGSPHFMSPEQAAGTSAGPPADVFAFGATVLYAATGRPPFGEGDLAAVLYRILHAEPDLSGCPEDLLPLVGSCLAKDPADRPTVSSVLEALPADPGATTVDWPPARAATGLDAYASPPEPPPTRPARRSVPVTAGLVGAAALLAASVIAAAVILRPEPPVQVAVARPARTGPLPLRPPDLPGRRVDGGARPLRGRREHRYRARHHLPPLRLGRTRLPEGRAEQHLPHPRRPRQGPHPHRPVLTCGAEPQGGRVALGGCDGAQDAGLRLSGAGAAS